MFFSRDQNIPPMAQDNNNIDIQAKCPDGAPERLRPNLSFEQGAALVQRWYPLEENACLKEYVSYTDQNFLVEAKPAGAEAEDGKEKFILKITNSEHSQLVRYFKELSDLMGHLIEKGITCPRPVMNVDKELATVDQLTFNHTGMFVCFPQMNREHMHKHIIA